MPNASSKNLAVFSGSRTEMAMWRSLLAMANSCDWLALYQPRADGRSTGSALYGCIRQIGFTHADHDRVRCGNTVGYRRQVSVRLVRSRPALYRQSIGTRE